VYGLTGKILRVDLTKGKISTDRVAEEDGRTLLGGRGLGAKILFQDLKPGVEPLGPENELLFMIGPITGTVIPGNARYCVMCKSPATGGLGEAHAAGYFGPRLRWAGFDGIALRGISSEPVYLWAHDGGAEIRKAGKLWGKTTHETEALVKKKIGEPSASVASIGVGGENLVMYACVLSDLHRAAGRTGVGAVMGSKRLKAVAVSGRGSVKVAKEAELRALAKDVSKRLQTHEGTINMTKHGTPFGVPGLNSMGILPTKNFQLGAFDQYQNISGETMSQTILKSTPTCYACPVRCIRVVEVKKGPYKGDFKDGPEYETVASLGSLLMNGSLEAVAMGNHLCNLHSIDTISAGAAIAFAMECYEKGLITKKDTDGLDLTWGNHEAMVKLIDKIAKREGFGNVLAEGVKRAAEKIGKGAEEFAVEVKGLEVPMHEPRGKKGVGLMYATAARGAVHTDAAHDPGFERDNALPEVGIVKKMDRLGIEGKADMIKKCQDIIAVQNSMIMCSFVGNVTFRPVTIADYCKMLNYSAGWNYTVEELVRAGERINNLCRAFNVREGFTRANDTLPKRLMEPIKGGAVVGQAIPQKDLDKMLDEYYDLRGWNKKTGAPTAQKLSSLGLDFAAKQLKSLGKI